VCVCVINRCALIRVTVDHPVCHDCTTFETGAP